MWVFKFQSQPYVFRGLDTYRQLMKTGRGPAQHNPEDCFQSGVIDGLSHLFEIEHLGPGLPSIKTVLNFRYKPSLSLISFRAIVKNYLIS